MSTFIVPRRVLMEGPGRLLPWLMLLLAACAVPPAKGEEQIVLDSLGAARARAFMDEHSACDRYVFPPGSFPEVRWERPEWVRELLGAYTSYITYYDREMRQVSRAEAPGRYAAVFRTSSADGFEVVRYLTLFCTNAEVDDYSPVVPVRLLPFTGAEIPAGAWERYAAETRRFSFGDLLMFPSRSPDAAVFLAGMAEWDSTKGQGWTPRTSDAQWWIDFKRKQGGAGPARILEPGHADNAARTLQPADPATTTFTSADVERLRSLCQRWADELGQPLVTLVAHRGAIVFHRGFAPGASTIPVSTPMWMASITKLLAGVLVMMAAEQGMIALDAPISNYIPECSRRSPASLTPRRLMTHTADLAWSGEWASDWNPSLENQIAHIAPTLQVGKRFEYTRAGYAVMGKVLERQTGLPVSVLLDRCLLRPLDMENAVVDNSYGGLYASALDVARVGQMLLNGGSYGTRRFLSPASVSAMAPKPLAGLNGNLSGSRGVGTVPVKGPGLSDAAYGHAAASGAVFCIDPELELVIVSARDRVGSDEAVHRAFVQRLIEYATSPVKAGGK
jgi:CubicO group peptidase (beta-lactamase class C family)